MTLDEAIKLVQSLGAHNCDRLDMPTLQAIGMVCSVASNDLNVARRAVLNAEESQALARAACAEAKASLALLAARPRSRMDDYLWPTFVGVLVFLLLITAIIVTGGPHA